MSVTPAQRRTALESLALPRLRELTALLDLHVFDGRSKEAHASALLAKPDLDLPELLASLKREELNKMCEAGGGGEVTRRVVVKTRAGFGTGAH